MTTLTPPPGSRMKPNSIPAASSLTLKNLMVVTLIGVPLVAAYTISVFWIFKGKVTIDKMSL